MTNRAGHTEKGLIKNCWDVVGSQKLASDHATAGVDFCTGVACIPAREVPIGLADATVVSMFYEHCSPAALGPPDHSS